MNLNLGIMQGRLLPMQKGRYQSHPLNWEKEFELCSMHGFNSIEWIIDKNSYNSNPFFTELGRTEIFKQIKKYNIKVDSICCDILMEEYCNFYLDFEKWADLLINLIEISSLMKVKVFVIPLIEKMSLRNKILYKLVVNKLNELTGYFEEKQIKIALELDLPPIQAKELLNKLNPEVIGINYDTGNSASLGFDVQEEFLNYGERIFDIHIKDRNLNGGPCLLGTGNANLVEVVKLIKDFKFAGPIIMQAFRDIDGLKITVLQKEWFKNIFEENFKI